MDARDALKRFARAFDAISGEQDAHHSARSFVRWLRLEAAPRDGDGLTDSDRERSAAA